MRNTVSTALMAVALIAPPKPVLISIGGHPLHWSKPTAITYAILTRDYVIPADKHVMSNTNCSAMHPFKEIVDHSPIPTEALKTQLQIAFHAWEDAANISFKEVTDPSQADIIVGAEDEENGRAFTNISYTDNGNLEQSYICLNPEQKWKVGFDGNLTVYDLRHTFTHELGHAIGLDHPADSDTRAIMSFKYDEKVTTLQPYDVTSVQQLYGPR